METIYTFISKKSLTAVLSLVFLLGVNNKTQAAIAFQETAISFNQYKGKVIDSKTRKSLGFATLTLENTNISTVTNTEGHFALKIPKNISEGNIIISFLGYKSKRIALSSLKPTKNKISLTTSVTKLAGVDVTIPKDAAALVRESLKRKNENYFTSPTFMTAFYRETIKKRRRNVSLSEAVVNIQKASYSSIRKDVLQLYKARKSTDYSRLDTLALKLQGGPFNTLFVDIMKYPEYIFSQEAISNYIFTYDRSTKINDRLIYVIKFKPYEGIEDQLYKGELFIAAESKVLTRATYALHITNKEKASKLFVRKKPSNARVYPRNIKYRVDYREKNGKWYYGYSSVYLEFKINWDKKLFNSIYSLTAEMAITDWEQNTAKNDIKRKERLKSSIILSDEAIGFSDPDFWGEYNIIEPEKSIESAIRKIKKQLRKSNNGNGKSTP
ncbi:MAG: carboxypeptidase-like regulatory domain-containing protein [Cellulophaga sp.]